MSAWAPLRHRVYRMLWLAQFVSNIGTFMQGVGAVWVMLELRQSPAVVALVQTAVALPVLLLGVPAGALADLTDRRRLLMATQGHRSRTTMTPARNRRPAATGPVAGGGAGLLMGLAGYRLEGSGAHPGVGEQRAGE